ncbi:MAG: hypothetical protein ACYC1C_21945, partial [Chloroflexota bacterium]
MTLIYWLAFLVIMVVVLAVIYPYFQRAQALMLKARREAELRAELALAETLSAEEKAQLDRHGYLDIPSRRHASRIYRVPRHQGMVSVYEGGKLAERLCVGAISPIPDGDTVLMHKLMIEGSEEEYLRIANHFTPRTTM